MLSFCDVIVAQNESMETIVRKRHKKAQNESMETTEQLNVTKMTECQGKM